MKYGILAAIILIFTHQSQAQVVPIVGPTVTFGVHGNLTIADLPGPMVSGATPLAEVYGFGYGGGVHLDITFVSLSLRVSGDFTTFSPDEENYRNALAALGAGTVATDFSIEGGRVNIISANVNGKLPVLPLPVVSPYVTGGVGLARISADAAEISFLGMMTSSYPGFGSETKTSVNIGVGVDFASLFVEAKYMWIFTDGETSSYVPVSIGISL